MGKVFFLLRLTAKFLAIFPHWLCCVVVRCQVGGWEDKNVFIFTTLKDGKATKQLKAIMRVVFLWCHRRRRDISRGVFKEIAFVLWCGWEYFVRIWWWGVKNWFKFNLGWFRISWVDFTEWPVRLKNFQLKLRDFWDFNWVFEGNLKIFWKRNWFCFFLLVFASFLNFASILLDFFNHCSDFCFFFSWLIVCPLIFINYSSLLVSH